MNRLLVLGNNRYCCFIYSFTRTQIFFALFILNLFYFSILKAQKKVDGWLPVVSIYGDTLKIKPNNLFVDRKDNFYVNLGAAGLYRWNDTLLNEVDSIVKTLPANGVNTLCDDSKGNLYGGAIYNAATGRWNVVKWDGRSWSSLGGTGLGMIDAWYLVYSVCTDKKDNVFAATIDKVLGSSYIAKWDGNSWFRIDTFSKLFAGYSEVLLQGHEDSVIYAAVNGLTTTGKAGVLKWDGHVWTEVGDLRANGKINCLIKDKLGNLYAAGYFSDNLVRTCVAKWDGVSWTYLGAGTIGLSSGSRVIRALFCDNDNNVFAGGDLSDKKSKLSVAKWDGFNWIFLGEEPATLSSTGGDKVLSIARLANGTIYTAGSFINYSTEVRNIGEYTTNIILSVDKQTIGSSQIKVFPNPSNSRVNVEIKTKGENRFHILLQSIEGRVIQKRILETQAGQENISFEVENLPSGTYLIVITDGISSQYSKLIVSH